MQYVECSTQETYNYVVAYQCGYIIINLIMVTFKF